MARTPNPLTEARKLLASRPDLAERLILLAAEGSTTDVVCSAANAASIFRPHLSGLEAEQLWCAALDRRRRVIDCGMLTAGSDAFTVVDPRQVYRWALTRKRPCAAIILAHNHPSGDPTPSHQDRDITRRIAAGGRTLGMPLLDHIIIGAGVSYRSLAEQGDLPHYNEEPTWTA